MQMTIPDRIDHIIGLLKDYIKERNENDYACVDCGKPVMHKEAKRCKSCADVYLDWTKDEQKQEFLDDKRKELQ